MILTVDSILEGLYAQSAVATLVPGSKAPFIHPDHSAALRVLIKDAFARLIAELPEGTFDEAEADDTTLSCADIEGFTAEAMAMAVRSAIIQIVGHVVAMASGEATAVPFPSHLAERFRPQPQPAEIAPWRA